MTGRWPKLVIDSKGEPAELHYWAQFPGGEWKRVRPEELPPETAPSFERVLEWY